MQRKLSSSSNKLIEDNLYLSNKESDKEELNELLKKSPSNISTCLIKISIKNNYKPLNIKTLPYPGYATDLQQVIIPFLTHCRGTSKVEETLYENRFQNVYDTNRMGANIIVRDNKIAKIKGVTPLQGKNVTATDLRGGASILICGLIAEGITTIDNVKYILRGYDNICEKLSKVGAKIELI